MRRVGSHARRRSPHRVTITSTDKYRIVGQVGSGGMGIVYHAVQTRLDRHVAIKVLKPRYARDPSFVQRFRQEARALAALPHTHIVQIYDVERVGDDLWIVMEWVEGRTLREVLKAEGPLPWDRALPLIRQCAAALRTAHEGGILHRDVKPENILLTTDDTVKMMDFGVSIFLDPDRNVADDSSLGVGSPRYMAPEQLAGEAADARADQYALALVVFELCTGHFPFVGSDIYAIGYEKLHGEPLRLQQFWEDAPAHVDAALLQALNRDPDLRFESLGPLMESLDPPPPRKLPLTPFALGAFVMLCLLAGAFYFLRPEAPAPVVVQQLPPTAQALPPAPVQPIAPPEPEPEPDPVIPLVAALDRVLVDEDYEQAERLIEEIRSHEPDHPRARTAQRQIQAVRAQEQMFADAVALYEDGAYGEARGMFRALLTAQPDHTVAQEYVARIKRQDRIHALLAAAREAQGARESANAKQAYRDVLALQPNQSEAKQALEQIATQEALAGQLAAAEAALAAGELVTARTAYETILTADATNLAAARGLARIQGIERERDRFDATAFAAELRGRSQGLAESVQALTEAVSAQERESADATVRQLGRATRSALRVYERRIATPLERLARTVDEAGAELTAFAARVEKVSDRYFASAEDRQNNQRDRLSRGVESMVAVLDAEGRAVSTGPARIAQRARGRLLGAENAEPVNRTVLVYRRPRSFFSRGTGQPMDPVEELGGELAPLRAALEGVMAVTGGAPGGATSPRATALGNLFQDTFGREWKGIAEHLERFNTAQQARSDRGKAGDATLTKQLEAAVAHVETQAATATERNGAALAVWGTALGAAGSQHTAHFVQADHRTQGVATRLTVELADLSADVSRDLANRQRASAEHIQATTTEQAWLSGEARNLTAKQPGAELLAQVDRLASEVPTRGETRGEEFTQVQTEFSAVAQAAQDRMAAYRRARITTLKARVNTLKQQVRDTAVRVDAWETEQITTLRAATALTRERGAAVDDAIDTWAEAVGQVRARFGQSTRRAFALLQRDIERATEEVEETEVGLAGLFAQLQQGGEGDPDALVTAGRDRIAALGEQLKSVAAAIERYDTGLNAALSDALAQRDAATGTLREALGAGGIALVAGASTFEADAVQRVTGLEQGIAGIVEESVAALAAFEAEAAPLAGPGLVAEASASG